MTRMTTVRVALAAVLGLAALGPSPAHAQGTTLQGLINDYTDTANLAGPWHISGSWVAKIVGRSGKGEFAASLGMLRLGTGGSPHSHHVIVQDATVTATATGWILTGSATITSNGDEAAMTGSSVTVEFIGGAAVLPATVKLTFHDAAAGHFGADPVDGIVSIEP